MSDPAGSSTLNWSLIVPWLLTVMTFASGIWQFTASQRQSNRQPFLQKQLEIAFQASEAASRLATETDPKKWEEARLIFWRLYWGPLSIVEDPGVETAMMALGEVVPKQSAIEPNLPMRAIEIPSYRLAHAIRHLVLTSWRVDLPPLRLERGAKS